MTNTGLRDTLGVEILIGDLVTVIAWGDSVRLTDVGRQARITGVTRARNLKHDNGEVAGGRAVRPGYVAVARRDGSRGHEGNL